MCQLYDHNLHVDKNRYHAPILSALREHQRHGTQATHVNTRKRAERRRVENLVLREDVAKLAALVDHYYAAYRDAAGLLERSNRELAELRSKLAAKPTLLPAPGGGSLLRHGHHARDCTHQQEGPERVSGARTRTRSEAFSRSHPG